MTSATRTASPVAAPPAELEPRAATDEATASVRHGFNWRHLDWPVVVGITLLHLGAVAAPFFFSWSGLALLLALVYVSGGLGVTLCFHRLLTHRSFKTPRWFEYFLTMCGCIAWQGGAIQWVGTHRIHHKHSDSDLDPHTPNHGFCWAHTFWCMHKYPDGYNAAAAAKDLQRDKVHRWLNRFFWLPQAGLAIGLFAAGQWLWPLLGFEAAGLSWFLWGVCLRTVIVYHGTWFVNSASHTWGYRNFETGDRSTNLWWVALLSFGEGWHNNHHAQQRSAAHGMRWWELDLTYLTIKALALIGLARDVVEPQRPA